MPENRSPTSDRRACRQRASWSWISAAVLTLLATPALPGENDPRQGRIDYLPDVRQARPTEDSVYFAASSASLDDSAWSVIRRHIARLEANPGLYLTLVAHTDELGSTALEIARGQDRLNVVQRILDEARIARTRIRTINAGSETSPAANCDDDACRRLRRRIDFLFHR